MAEVMVDTGVGADGSGEVKSAINMAPGHQMAVGGTFPEKFDGFLHPRSMPVISLFLQSYMVCCLVDSEQHSSNLERHNPRKTQRFSKEYTGLNLQFKFHQYYFLKLSCLGTHPSPT